MRRVLRARKSTCFRGFGPIVANVTSNNIFKPTYLNKVRTVITKDICYHDAVINLHTTARLSFDFDERSMQRCISEKQKETNL